MKLASRIYPSFGFILLIALLLVGCRRGEPPQFSPSAEFRSLIDDAESDEDRELWKDLQKQTEAELAKRCGAPLSPIVFGDPEADRTTLQLGAQVFAYRCQSCHGIDGNGLGQVAGYLNPKPRDYTKGVFKFTSTPLGAKPRRADLLRTLRRGVTGTSMPAFDDLDPKELNAVVDYVIFLSQRGELERELILLGQDEGTIDPEYIQDIVDAVRASWQEAQSQLVMPLTPMPPMTGETIAKGRELYLHQACNKCHGVDGRGGLAGDIDVGKDAWGNEAAAADLTSGMFRGGGRPIDIYRRIYTGINGTPMPSFAVAFASEPDNIWYLVHFVRDLGERRRRNLPPSMATTDQTSPTTQPSNAPATEPDANDSKKAASRNQPSTRKLAALFSTTPKNQGPDSP